jgi:hypothetical protein
MGSLSRSAKIKRHAEIDEMDYYRTNRLDSFRLTTHFLYADFTAASVAVGAMPRIPYQSSSFGCKDAQNGRERSNRRIPGKILRPMAKPNALNPRLHLMIRRVCLLEQISHFFAGILS